MPGGNKRAADAALIAHLAAGVIPAGAAKLAGVSEATAYRRLANPAFRQRVEDARAELWKRASAVLSKSAVEGAIVLRRLLRSDDAKVRLQAAKIVLEQGMKVRDQVDIAQRVAALEELAQQQKDSRR
jgi:transposase